MKETPSTVCPFCGAPLTIEGDFCPNCGSKKTQFTEHRQKMKAYKKAFEETKEGVVEENKKTTKNAALIAICAVLVAIILGELIVMKNSYSISRKIAAKEAKGRKTQILQMLKEYEENEEYVAIMSMWDENVLRYLNDDQGFREYAALNMMCGNYESVISALEYLQRADYYHEVGTTEYKEETERWATNVGEYYTSFMKRYETYVENFDPDYKYYTYHPDGFSGKHMETFAKMKENVRVMVAYYFDIPFEDMDEFDALSPAKRNARLCEAWEAKHAEEE
ncbi:MAG: hypothetical protein IK068_07670 [Lachnospiraceae bacterium]|nr:hypothetical protein [Lachnospiraceae bacterium]